DGAKPMKAGYGKAGKQKTLSSFPTATTTTNYNYLWDTDSEGKVKLLNLYNQAIESTHALQLGEYVRKEDFKGYLSTSKSTAIAKQFVNAGDANPGDVT